ncbi:MAG TPA: hypothetical protein VLB47_15275 [Solirubrobacteraceae bacterium]|nr:hypothetical protein [Solirubrobacteraceae bacterium]
MRSLRAPLAVAAALAALAPAAAQAGAPQGGGLLQGHESTCSGLGDVTMTLSGGTSFWIGDSHYLVKSVTFSGGYTGTYAYGNKTGLGATIQCQGTFAGPPAYGVVSQDVLVK